MDNKLLILDVDGVMTDGTKVYDRDHVIIAKNYCDKDFTAIRSFQDMGWSVCLLSADRFNQAMSLQRKIDFYYAREPDGSIDKVGKLADLMKYYCVEDFKDVYYVGDDIHDYDLSKHLLDNGGNTFCPIDAALKLRSLNSGHNQGYVLPVPGGHNVVARLYEKVTEGML